MRFELLDKSNLIFPRSYKLRGVRGMKGGNVSSCKDYYAGGSLMPGRNFNSTEYRYGFNGQEKVDEMSGNGNHNTALFWEYDTRLIRRWNLDPKPQINVSDYACFYNNPIAYNDVLGDEADFKLSRQARKELGLSRKEARNYTPEKISKTFADEYGMKVEVQNGKLVHTGDATPTGTVSETAKEMWSKELAKGYPSLHSFEISSGTRNPDFFAYNTADGDGGSVTTIDLGYFNSDLTLVGGKYENLETRSLNLGRVLEHEYLGHGVKHLNDAYDMSKNPENHGYFNGSLHPGDNVKFTNFLRGEMRLPIQTIYGGSTGQPWREGNRTMSFYIINFYDLYKSSNPQGSVRFTYENR